MEKNYYTLKRAAIADLRKLVLEDEIPNLTIEAIVFKIEGNYGLGILFVTKQLEMMQKMGLIRITRDNFVKRVDNGN